MISGDSALHENSITETLQAQIALDGEGFWTANATKGHEIRESQRAALVDHILKRLDGRAHCMN
jgi:hypothetical protein